MSFILANKVFCNLNRFVLTRYLSFKLMFELQVDFIILSSEVMKCLNINYFCNYHYG